MSNNHRSSDEDEPPPLEDMSEQLAKATTQFQQTRLPGLPNLSTSTHLKQPQQSQKTATTQPSHTSSQRSSTNSTNTPATVIKESSKTNNSSSSFGGFQKGFLFSAKQSSSARSSSKPSQAKPSSNSQCQERDAVKSADDVIRPKQQKSSNLEFPEVQEAMKESFPFLNTDSWVTDDLLSKIEKDPVLSEAFKDPALSQAMSLFQTDPQRAMEAAKDKPKIEKFLRSFSALMGEHFTDLADSEAKNSGPAPPVSEIVSQEEAKMQEIIAKPEVKQVLADPVIRKLIETLKIDPNSAQQLFHSGGPELKQKIKVLIDNGLLALN